MNKNRIRKKACQLVGSGADGRTSRGAVRRDATVGRAAQTPNNLLDSLVAPSRALNLIIQ